MEIYLTINLKKLIRFFIFLNLMETFKVIYIELVVFINFDTSLFVVM